MTGWGDIRRKAAKAARLLRTPRYRLPLALGVAAACEHEPVLAGLPVRTVVDAGANKGQFALLALELFPEATVHAFEPLSAPFARMTAWGAAETRLIRHRLALTTDGGTALMQVSARADSSSLRAITGRQTAVFPGTHQVGTEAVETARLDAVLGPDRLTAPALLKIDVQGGELEVLAGAGPLLAAFDWIYAECSFEELYAGQALVPDVTAFLADAGFDPLLYWNPVRDRGGRPVQADILFGRRPSAPAPARLAGVGQHPDHPHARIEEPQEAGQG